MAFVLKEEIIKNLVEQVNKENPAFQFDWQTYILTTQQSGRTVSYHLLVENQDYIAVISLSSIDVRAVTGIQIIAKSEVQGYKFKSGAMVNQLIFRMYSGKKYLFKVRHKAGKHLPSHQDNLIKNRMAWAQTFATQTDMKNHNTNFFEHFLSFLATILFFVILFIVLIATNSKTIAIIVSVALALSGGLICDFIKKNREKKLDKHFLVAYKHFEEANKDSTPQVMYKELQSITPTPTTPTYQVDYYTKLMKMAHHLGQDDEARSYLEQIPRRSSQEAEQQYFDGLNYLATPIEEITDTENSNETV